MWVTQNDRSFHFLKLLLSCTWDDVTPHSNLLSTAKQVANTLLLRTLVANYYSAHIIYIYLKYMYVHVQHTWKRIVILN
jgi:hypothetical protein